MTVDERYRERYKAGETPWDVGRGDFNLIEVVTRKPISPCKALDIGCGTGDNALWLAQNDFQITGTDASEIALGKARGKFSQAGLECRFIQVDFLNDSVEGAPFGFAFDRGCFHSFPSESDRSRFARNVKIHRMANDTDPEADKVLKQGHF